MTAIVALATELRIIPRFLSEEDYNLQTDIQQEHGGQICFCYARTGAAAELGFTFASRRIDAQPSTTFAALLKRAPT